jgi:NAD(P)-dependent dehydrogenase (short-subunit alcohol dehydrogenase family)
MDLKITEADIPDLLGKVAVVTGGSNGIGYGAIQVLLDHHARVYNFDIQEPTETEYTKNENYNFLKADVSDWSSIVDAFSTAVLKEKKIDIVISNAGRPEEGTYLKTCLTAAPTEEDGWKRLREEAPGYLAVKVNFEGTLNVVMLASRILKQQEDGGSIVMTTSATGYLPEHSIPEYCATKGGVSCV